MISKDQFLELKHLKSLGVPTTNIAKKIGISVPVKIGGRATVARSFSPALTA